jgi:hypothetical protein
MELAFGEFFYRVRIDLQWCAIQSVAFFDRITLGKQFNRFIHTRNKCNITWFEAVFRGKKSIFLIFTILYRDEVDSIRPPQVCIEQ